MVAMAAGSGVCAAGFSDDFSSSGLNSRWNWRAPKAGPAWSIQGGRLEIALPEASGGFDVWTNADNAPSLMTAPPPGDWDMEARLQLVGAGAGAEFHAGLAERFADGRTMIWGPYQSRRYAGVAGPQVWLERSGEGRMAAVAMPGESIDLRVEKRGARYSFSLRKAGQTAWRRVAATSALSEPSQIGIVVKSFAEESQSSGAVTVAIDRISVEGVKVAGAPEATVAVDVTPDGLFKVDRNIYGHFIEHLGRCIQGGVWAELIDNRKFAGDTSAEGVIQGWERVGDAVFSDGHDDPYTGGQFQRITLKGSPAGIAQGSVGLIRGKSYDVRVIARAKGSASLSVSLDGARKDLGAPGAEWKELKGSLSAPGSRRDGRFEIIASGSGSVDIGCVSVMPADNLSGFRRDVIEVVRAIKPPNVRWPGGNFVSGYDWREGVGPRDKRPPRWDRAWGAWEMNDMGTDEFMDFCRLLDTEPYICVNAGEGTPRQAAEWVEYCNGGPDTAMGAMRKANGHPDPYNVLLWGTGNEIWGDWQLGHVGPVTHGLTAVELARAMRSVDPRLKLVLCGVDGDSYGDWNRKLLPIAGAYHDYLAVHYYKNASFADPPEVMYEAVVTAPDDVEERLRHTFEIIKEKLPDRPIPIAFDEWNVSYARTGKKNPDAEQPPLGDALFEAGVFHAMIRLGDRVTLANLAQLVNVLGLLRVSDTGVLKTPGFLAFQMYAPYFYGRAQNVTVPEDLKGLVDVVAVQSDDGSRLAIGLINRSLDRAHTVTLQIHGFEGRRVQQMRINADSIEAMNTWAHPDTITIATDSPAWSPRWELPAHSVTTLLLER